MPTKVGGVLSFKAFQDHHKACGSVQVVSVGGQLYVVCHLDGVATSIDNVDAGNPCCVEGCKGHEVRS